MPADPNVKCGTAAIIRKDGYMLMLLRHGADGSGKWSVPGGWMESGETPQEAAVRETMEETGIVVKPVGEPGVITFTAEDGSWIVDLFVECEHVSGLPMVLEPDKCKDVTWVHEDVLPSPLYAPLILWLGRQGKGPLYE